MMSYLFSLFTSNKVAAWDDSDLTPAERRELAEMMELEANECFRCDQPQPAASLRRDGLCPACVRKGRREVILFVVLLVPAGIAFNVFLSAAWDVVPNVLFACLVVALIKKYGAR